jgi:hypothetical protein
MATNVRFELRRGTSGPWQQANPVLASGEPGVETDTGNMKVGDGVTQWNSLPYFTPTFDPVTNVISIGRDIYESASIRIGKGAGSTQQTDGLTSVSIGTNAGATGTGEHTVAIGTGAGRRGQQSGAIAIGQLSGSSSAAGSTGQGIGAVAIGRQAAQWGQGNYSIAIGQSAASVDSGSLPYSQPDNSIVLNASGVPFAGPTGITGGFYVSPIRSVPNTGNPLFLTSNNEIVVGVPSGSTGLSIVSINPGSALATSTVLSAGQFSIEMGTVNMKIGDGVTQWAYLPYFIPSFYPFPNVISIGRDIADNASIRIGKGAGSSQQSTIFHSVSIGSNAGATGSGENTVAIGTSAGRNNQQSGAIAIGSFSGSGRNGTTGQGVGAVAIGREASQWGQGDYSIAIGQSAASVDSGSVPYSQPASTIILNATGAPLSAPQGSSGGFYVSPIRSVPNTGNPLFLTSNNEIVVGVSSGSSGGTAGLQGPTGASLQNFVGSTGINVNTLGSTISISANIVGSTGINVGVSGSTITISTLADPIITPIYKNPVKISILGNVTPQDGIYHNAPFGTTTFGSTIGFNFAPGYIYSITGQALLMPGPATRSGGGGVQMYVFALTAEDPDFIGATGSFFSTPNRGFTLFQDYAFSGRLLGTNTTQVGFDANWRSIPFSYTFLATSIHTKLRFFSYVRDFADSTLNGGSKVLINELTILTHPYGEVD